MFSLSQKHLLTNIQHLQRVPTLKPLIGCINFMNALHVTIQLIIKRLKKILKHLDYSRNITSMMRNYINYVCENGQLQITSTCVERLICETEDNGCQICLDPNIKSQIHLCVSNCAYLVSIALLSEQTFSTFNFLRCAITCVVIPTDFRQEKVFKLFILSSMASMK